MTQVNTFAPTNLPCVFTSSVSAPNIEGVQYADQFTGSDIGAKVNAAMAALPSTGGTVYIPAGAYNFSTTIQMLKNCQLIGAGSCATLLYYTGTGDAIQLVGTNNSWGTQPPYMNGLLRGFTITGNGNTYTSKRGIHHIDCIGTTYDDLVVSFFNQTNDEGMCFDNQVLFSERVTMRKLSILNNTIGIVFQNSNSGTPGNSTSFGYHRWSEIHFQVAAAQYGIFVNGTNPGNCYLYNGHFAFDANLNSTNPATLCALVGTCSMTGTFDVYSEDTGFSGATGFYVGSNAALVGVGNIVINSLNNSIQTGGIYSVNESVLYADQFPGTDLGAKINAAFASGASNITEVRVNNAAGNTITTAVTIPTGSVLRFVQGGTYILNATISMGLGSALIGTPTGNLYNLFSGITHLIMGNGTNLSSMINLSGTNINSVLLQDISVDGNASLNASAGPNILFSASGNGFHILRNVTSRNSNSHGFSIGSGSGNDGIGTLIDGGTYIGNAGNGIYLNCLTDVFIRECQIENNTAYGIGGVGDSIRVDQCDISGNQVGILATGSSSYASETWLIAATQFGNNLQGDVTLNGTSNNYCLNWTINGCVFDGLSSSATTNTYDAIKSNGGGGLTVTGCIFVSTTKTYAYGIQDVSGNTYPSVFANNVFSGTFGTNPYQLQTGSLAPNNVFNNGATNIGVSLTQTTASTATGGSATLPSNPVGFVDILISGTTYKLPYYSS
jgi:hypothetical protein